MLLFFVTYTYFSLKMNGQLEVVRLLTNKFAAGGIEFHFYYKGGTYFANVLPFVGNDLEWQTGATVFGNNLIYRIISRKGNYYFEVFINNKDYYAWLLDATAGIAYEKKFDLTNYVPHSNLNSVITNVTFKNNNSTGTHELQFNNSDIPITFDNSAQCFCHCNIPKNDIWLIGNEYHKINSGFAHIGKTHDYINFMDLIANEHIIKSDIPKGGIQITKEFQINLRNTKREYDFEGSPGTKYYSVSIEEISQEKKEPEIDLKLHERNHNTSLAPIIEFIEKNGLQLHYPTQKNDLREVINKNIPSEMIRNELFDIIIKKYDENKGLMIRSNFMDIITEIKKAATYYYNLHNDRNAEYKRIYQLTNCCTISTNPEDQMKIYDYMRKAEDELFSNKDLPLLNKESRIDSILRVAAAKIHGIIYDSKKQVDDKRQPVVVIKLNEAAPKTQQIPQTFDEIVNHYSLSDYQKTIMKHISDLQTKLAKTVDDWTLYNDATVKLYNDYIDQIINSFDEKLGCLIVRIFQKPIYEAVKRTIERIARKGYIDDYNKTSIFLRTLALHSEFHPIFNALVHKLPNKKKAGSIILGTGTFDEKREKIYQLLKSYVIKGRCKCFSSERNLKMWYDSIVQEYI